MSSESRRLLGCVFGTDDCGNQRVDRMLQLEKGGDRVRYGGAQGCTNGQACAARELIEMQVDQ